MRTDGVQAADDGSEPSIMSLRATVKEVVIGSFAGIVSEVVEYPADLAKVRLQAQLLTPPADESQRFKGPMDCLRQTWKHEGFRGLYRGLPAPVAGSMVETAALFLSYSYFQNLIRTYAPSPSSPELTIPQLGLAAGGAGFVTSFILTPIELVKCKMQVQLMNTSMSARVPPIHAVPKSVAALARAPLTTPSPIFDHILGSSPTSSLDRGRPPGLVAIVRSTIASHGIRGLWLGHTGTLLRETGGTASWFAVKEGVASALLERRLGPNRFPGPSSALLPWESAVAGAISGAACVLALYPADTVKSAMQTEEELLSHRPASTQGRKLAPPSFYRTFAKMYATHGVRGLYAGCGMTVVRAVPSSGIVFVVYDGLSAWIG
ncbi:mitochondrial carrier [Mycena maculata]|uniref:Mitochondrial carrier n=1 Tax=Mycena maculata TaxID=230809 RepID=A0AAD7J685_9AGAR|nr:mitochondrial carrier [Mycena maculata]